MRAGKKRVGKPYASENRDPDCGPKGVDEFVFLSPEWIREVLRLVQCARRHNESFRRLAREFSLKLAYVVTDLPKELQRYYDGSSQLVIFVQLDKGTVRRFEVRPELPGEECDFTVYTEYGVAKRIFQGDLTPGSSFINRLVRVEPLSKVYRRPKFAARSIVVGNLILKFARRARTVFVPEW